MVSLRDKGKGNVIPMPECRLRDSFVIMFT
jgi:hypothetical protein